MLSENSLDRLLVEWKLLPRVGQTVRGVFQFLGRVEVAGVEIASPIEGAVVGRMEYPGARSPLLRRKQDSFAKDVEKDLLHQVVCLRFILQYAEGDIAHCTRV